MTLLLRRYGAGPLHVLGHVACLALAGYAIGRLVGVRGDGNALVWFLGALVLHDLLFLPCYAGLDRLAARAAPPGPAINYVRVPAVVSGVLALVYFPILCGKGDGGYTRVSGLEYEGYVRNWLLIVFVVFAASALLYAIRGRRAAARRPRP